MSESNQVKGLLRTLIERVNAMRKADENGVGDDAKWRHRWKVVEAADRYVESLALPSPPAQAEE